MRKSCTQQMRAQKFACNLVLLVIALAVSASAQLTTLASFDSSNGYIPNGPIARDSAGNIYGSTAYGGGEARTSFQSRSRRHDHRSLHVLLIAQLCGWRPAVEWRYSCH